MTGGLALNVLIQQKLPIRLYFEYRNVNNYNDAHTLVIWCELRRIIENAKGPDHDLSLDYFMVPLVLCFVVSVLFMECFDPLSWHW